MLVYFQVLHVLMDINTLVQMCQTRMVIISDQFKFTSTQKKTKSICLLPVEAGRRNNQPLLKVKKERVFSSLLLKLRRWICHWLAGR
jgi:hypothetical protein